MIWQNPLAWFGLLTLASIAGIAVLIYVLNCNPGGIVINLQAGATDGGAAVVPTSPVERPPRPPADPVMGGLLPAPEQPSGRSRDDAAQLAAADNWLASLGNRAGEMPAEAGTSLAAEAGYTSAMVSGKHKFCIFEQDDATDPQARPEVSTT